eukprot:s2496_g6.t1
MCRCNPTSCCLGLALSRARQAFEKLRAVYCHSVLKPVHSTVLVPLRSGGVLLDHLTCAFQADVGWEYVAWVAFGLAAHGVGEGYQTGCKLHLHHWYWAFLACHYAVFDCLLSRFAQAAFLGIYIHGAALFGLESIYEPSEEIAARLSADEKRTQLSKLFSRRGVRDNAGAIYPSQNQREVSVSICLTSRHLLCSEIMSTEGLCRSGHQPIQDRTKLRWITCSKSSYPMRCSNVQVWGRWTHWCSMSLWLVFARAPIFV